MKSHLFRFLSVVTEFLNFTFVQAMVVMFLQGANKKIRATIFFFLVGYEV